MNVSEADQSFNNTKIIGKANIKRDKVSLLMFLSYTFLVTFLNVAFFSGSVSFARRMGELLYFHYSESKHINTINSISLPQQVVDEKLSPTKTDHYVVDVVYIGFIKNHFWNWTLDGIISKIEITQDSTYGVAVPLNNSKILNKNLTNLLERGILEDVSFLPGSDRIFVETNRGNLDIHSFKSIAKSGNLIKVIYNKSTNELVGAILVDFDRI